MFPIGDYNPTQRTPYVTYALIALNIVVFIHQMSLSMPQLEQFFQLYAVVPVELTASFSGSPVNQPVAEPLTLITSQFLHGDLFHLAGNMWFLWLFGNNVEDKLGHGKYLFFYISCGILAALSQWIFSLGSQIPSLGASGAIAGVMGAYILRFPTAPIRTLVPLFFFFFFVDLPAYFFLGYWFAIQALSGLSSLGIPTDTGGIAYWAHAGGFVFGAILGPMLGLFSED